jgi:RecB family endonuclease NucS
MVLEFSTRREGPEKARQLLRYVDQLTLDGGRAVQAVLVATAYEGDATSRHIQVDGGPVMFVNWADFLHDLIDDARQTKSAA